MKLRVVLLAFLIALLQIGMHAAGASWVVPNLTLIFVVWYAPKLEYITMTLLIVFISMILEVGSILPTGLLMLGLFLVMLAAKLVFRDGRDASKWSFQLALIIAATVLFNIVFYATLPASLVASHLGYVGVRIFLEVLYNSSILLLVMGLSDKRTQTHLQYRLPQ